MVYNSKKVIATLVLVIILLVQFYWFTTNTLVLKDNKFLRVLPLDSRWTATQPQIHVILLAYMRSGSSFVGNILQSNPDVFYIFEPLYQIEKFLEDPNDVPITFLDKPPFFLKDKQYKEVVNEFLASALSCRFSDLDIDTLAQMHWIRTTTTPYYNCIYQVSAQTNVSHVSPVSNILKCLHLLYKQCDTKPVSLAKVIRYRMIYAEKLLLQNPKYKVIHLVRDPRAMLYSRHRIGYQKMDYDIVNRSKRLCDEIYDDLTTYQYLKPQYNNRIILIRYEDIVEQPISQFKKIYDAIGVNFTSKQEQYIKGLTTRSGGENCSYCVSSKKSSQTAHAWRYTIQLQHVKTIEENCVNVFGYLGYKTVDTKRQLMDKNYRLYNYRNETPILLQNQLYPKH